MTAVAIMNSHKWMPADEQNAQQLLVLRDQAIAPHP
jgi:hypothetical protein